MKRKKIQGTKYKERGVGRTELPRLQKWSKTRKVTPLPGLSLLCSFSPNLESSDLGGGRVGGQED